MTEQGLCVQDDACMVDVLMEKRKDVLVGYKGKRKKWEEGKNLRGEKNEDKKGDSLFPVYFYACA